MARDKEERAARKRLYSAGLPIVLQAPHLFGKTWLLERLLAPLRADPNWRLVELDLAALSDGERSDAGGLRRALGRRILLGCGEPPDWRTRPPAADLDSAAHFSELLRRVLAASVTPLCLSVDRADDLPESVRTGLYKQLRAFIDAGAHDEAWARLQLVLCISTTPDELQKDSTASPFNGAHKLLLDEFNDAQVQELLERYGLRWSPEERQEVRERVGGHPYLLRLLMDEVADNGTPVAALFDQNLPALEDYLARLDRRLPAELRTVLRKVVEDPTWQPPQAEYWRLHRMGLLEREVKSKRVRLRGSLYQRLV